MVIVGSHLHKVDPDDPPFSREAGYDLQNFVVSETAMAGSSGPWSDGWVEPIDIDCQIVALASGKPLDDRFNAQLSDLPDGQYVRAIRSSVVIAFFRRGGDVSDP